MCIRDRFILEIIDWDLNVDPEFWSHRFTPPVETDASAAAGRDRYVERWITYRSPAFSAKELTVAPGCEVSIDESDAYGFIAVDGFGEINGQEVSAISSIRYGQLSHDEYFVTSSAAQAGVRIRNTSPSADPVSYTHLDVYKRQISSSRSSPG